MGVALSIWELRGDVQVNFNLGTNGLALSENVCHGASYNLRKAAWVPITGFILSHHPPHTHTHLSFFLIVCFFQNLFQEMLHCSLCFCERVRRSVCEKEYFS